MKRSTILLIFVTVLVCCGLFFGAFVYFDRRSASELEQVRREVRAAGLPLEPRDLAQTLPPEAQNAAPLYVQLNGYLAANPLVGADKILDDVRGVLLPTPQEHEQLRQAIQHRQDVLKRVHEAAKRPFCAFNRDYGQGASLLLPEYSKMREGVRVLTAETTLLLADGKPLDAIRNETPGFQMAQHAATDPIIIGNLVGIALDSITLRGMEKVLYADGEQPGVAQAVEQSIAQNWKPHSLAYGLRGEFVMGTVEIERMRKAGPVALKELGSSLDGGMKGQAQKLGLMQAAGWQKFLNRNQAVVLRELKQTTLAADLPFWEAHPILKAAEARLERKKADGDSDYILASILLPVFAQAEVKQAQNRAQAAVVRSAASLLAWKQRHGAFPDTLNQAMKTVPMDPFDGKPLRYRREGAGFVVYSVGETGKFDGGMPARKPDSYETVFHYPIPAYLLHPAKP